MSPSQGASDSALHLLLQRCRNDGVLPPEPVNIAALQGDASDRRFFRIRRGPVHFIGLVSPRKTLAGLDENDSYFLIGTHLARHSLPVPRIVWADRGEGLFLLQDVGDCHLQKYVKRTRVDAARAYRSAVSLLVRLHRLTPDGFETGFCFDSAVYSPAFVYQRELEYFRKSFLNDYLGLEVAAEDLRGDFEQLAEAAGVDKTSLVMHRDFQSRNIMVRHGKLWLLDFQGMRHGPPAYDLASLVLDPYTAIPARLQQQLCEYYWTGARSFVGCSRREFQSSYLAVRLCRNLQVLGAYGFLGAGKGKRQFLQYIPHAWQQLRQWVYGRLKGRYPKLQRCIEQAGRSPTFRRHGSPPAGAGTTQ